MAIHLSRFLLRLALTLTAAAFPISVFADSVTPTVAQLFYLIYPAGSDEPVHSPIFEDQNLTNGYLRVTGQSKAQSDTYYVFKSFRHNGEDLVLESQVTCMPACTQELNLYKFSGQKFTKQLFKTAYPFAKVEAHLRNYRAKLPLLNAGSQYLNWIFINKKNDEPEIIVMDQNFGDISGRLKVYRAGRLKIRPNSDSPKDSKDGYFQFEPVDSIKQTRLRPVDLH
jgi:hypothetical protein